MGKGCKRGVPEGHTRQLKDLILKLSLKSDTKKTMFDFSLLNCTERLNTYDFGIGIGIGIAIGGITCHLGMQNLMFTKYHYTM